MSESLVRIEALLGETLADLLSLEAMDVFEDAYTSGFRYTPAVSSVAFQINALNAGAVRVDGDRSLGLFDKVQDIMMRMLTLRDENVGRISEDFPKHVPAIEAASLKSVAALEALRSSVSKAIAANRAQEA